MLGTVLKQLKSHPAVSVSSFLPVMRIISSCRASASLMGYLWRSHSFLMSPGDIKSIRLDGFYSLMRIFMSRWECVCSVDLSWWWRYFKDIQLTHGFWLDNHLLNQLCPCYWEHCEPNVWDLFSIDNNREDIFSKNVLDRLWFARDQWKLIICVVISREKNHMHYIWHFI